LSRFATENKEKFKEELGKATLEQEESLSSYQKTYGTARTAINTFFQMSRYNRYLSESFD
jgi:hypothetical protein